ncbi:MAG: hypothetical protein ACI4R6_03715 [Lachnospiraceae bacterium]
MYDSIEFGKYLNSLREKGDISMTAVCDGICNTSTLSRIENGKKEVSKLVQDRLLGRLGVTSENFENMIFYDEYDRWMLMQEIVKLVQHEEMDKADALLDRMESEWNIRKRRESGDDLDAILELQFCLCMKAQIRCYQKADERELRDRYYEALSQTVMGFQGGDAGKNTPERRYLSIEEINLIIEYCRYLPTAEGLIYIRDVIEFIEERFTDKLAKAKVYPKAIYYFYLIENRNGLASREKNEQLLKLATKAIECLRTVSRSYYLCELLDMKIDLIEKIAGNMVSEWKAADAGFDVIENIDIQFEEHYGNTDEYSLKAQYTWCRTNRYVLEQIYDRAGVKSYMCEFCYIYADMEVYCIEEIIRTRRKMLGMNLKELSVGICSDRTVIRIEKKATKPQRYIIHQLLVSLGLSGEFCRIEIISPDTEVHEMFNKLRTCLNNREFDKVDELLDIITARVDTGIVQNRQVLARIRSCNMYRSGKIDGREFIKRIKEVLEYTIPYNVAVADTPKYMTNEELACLQNILATKLFDEPEVRECYDALLKMYEPKEKNINNHLGMYEFVMLPLSSYMGDFGMYDKADEKDSMIFVNVLYNRRLMGVMGSLYDMLWNDMQRKERNIAMHRDITYKDELKRCMVLSSLIKKKKSYRFYHDKLRDSAE